MKKDLHVEVNTKTGRTYIYDNVIKINYNFNHGTMINIAVRSENGKRAFKVFSKKDVEAIGVVIPTEDDGNNQEIFEDNREDSYLPDYNGEQMNLIDDNSDYMEE